ncbi:MAG: hypothetical protein QOC87_452, partial [Actinomycetota bacterium]|nr:hypothetical protein [Actinomycetota bacterium]
MQVLMRVASLADVDLCQSIETNRR